MDYCPVCGAETEIAPDDSLICSECGWGGGSEVDEWLIDHPGRTLAEKIEDLESGEDQFDYPEDEWDE